MSNLLVVHGGGPTTVLNASLYGVIKEASKHDEIETIYGALEGTAGFLQEAFVKFNDQPSNKIELLKSTPGTAIGTSRTPLYEAEYKKMLEVLLKHDIKYVIFNGGNGTMDACGHLAEVCKDLDICVMGVPKTIDNDLAQTDHSPGFGSAARYMAVSVAETAQDVKAMPIHVAIVESMGRNAGWIAASSALARKEAGDAPHMILLPEVPFDEEAFLRDVKIKFEELGGVVVVASEGLKYADGTPIAKPIYQTERATYYGDVAAYLSELIIKKLGIKSRNEKPGILGRASATLQSVTDRDEAILAGEEAVKATLEGESGKMVAFKRLSGDSYSIETILVPIEAVMLHEKTMPASYMDIENYDVTQEFIDYCRPLIGDPVPDYVYFERHMSIVNKVK